MAATRTGRHSAAVEDGASKKRSLRGSAPSRSYADPDTDEEDGIEDNDEEVASPPAPRKTSTRPPRSSRPPRRSTTQARKRYAELDTDDESEDDDAEFEPEHASPRRTATATLRSTRRQSWRTVRREVELDGDERQADEEARQLRRAARPPARKRQKTSRRSQPQGRGKTNLDKSKKIAKLSLSNIGKKRRWNTAGATPKREFTGPSDGMKPDWTSLPISVLRDMFIFASRPVHEQTRVASANVDWLMKTARVCPAFTIPALEAYYLSPALHTNLQPHHLLELLQIPSEKQYMNYKVKIKSLSIDVRRLAYTATGKGLFDISLLTQQCQQLQHLEISHPVDEPPFRPINIRPWHYPSDLFDRLEQHDIRLRSWRWSRNMIPVPNADKMYEFMMKTHTSRAFERLEKLTVCGYDWNDSAEPVELEDDAIPAAAAPGLATSISLLAALKDLTFISCEVLVDKFLERLPPNLERLEITNCLELTSTILHSYLLTHGSQLRELVLNHNSALNLTFLTSLKAACPRLEILKMDLRYYSEKINSNDAEPLYDELLGNDDIPTWPPTLRHLELTQLQRWEAEAAEHLFQSLVDSSPDLPDLRKLILHSHIDIPWRQRAAFRDQWIDRLQHVYARRAEAPNPYLGSKKMFRQWKQAQAGGWKIEGSSAGKAKLDDPEDEDEEFLVGSSVRDVVMPPAKEHEGDTDVFSESSPEKKDVQPGTDDGVPRIRRSTRVAESVVRHSLPASSAESQSDDGEAEDEINDDGRNTLQIQGLCTIVDIRIDNQRPRETEFTIGDFLDEERSGDEEWNESGDDGEERGGYAW
ncbi:hypothetical protein LTR62_007192 [Meristemomyces frigidus]|uniref:Uncharacterized protein n=1 Tax=Meristemomyces frigidus TaxID=1508187 RepID=A0AAN7TMH5_9PEZI|nr:hypothetical protein LTR62_007192 [Meristemomyces frigidus]